MRRIAAVLWCAGLVGCAALPPSPSPPPFHVAHAIEQHLNQPMRWGGMIVETRNFDRYSEIELIAFPLDRAGQPDLRARDIGRFIALESGFIDPTIHAPGRLLTITGRVTGDRRGTIGGAEYVWPELDADRIQLWRDDFRTERPRISIGIGFSR